MAVKKITDLTQLTDLDATDSFVVNDSGAGADKRVEFSDLQSEVLNGASIGTSTAITELQVDNLNLNGNTISSTDTNGNIIIEANGTGDVIVNEGGGDSDFRVEGSTDQNLLFVDASTDRVGIGTSGPGASLEVRKDGSGEITVARFRTDDGADQGRLDITVNATDNEITYKSTGSVGGAHVFDAGNIERMRIDSSGNVGIGTSSPVMGLQIGKSSGNVLYGGFDGNSNEFVIRGNIYYDAGNARSQPIATGYQTQIDLSNQVGAIKFSTSTSSVSVGGAATLTERMRITSDGYLRMASGSGGIQFGGDTAAANALNDYDTGTYTATLTPTTSGTITLSATGDQLSYTKIGRLMTIIGRIGVDSVSSPLGAIQLNLPTAIANLSDKAGHTTGSIFIQGSSLNINQFGMTGIEGDSYVTIYATDGTTPASDSADSFGSGELVWVSFTYVSA